MNKNIDSHIKPARLDGLPEALRLELKQARFTRGWSQTELGRRAGLPQAHISGIEAGKIVPRFAISKRPCLRAFAPVKAPFSYPKSSLSSSSSGSAAQLTLTNGPFERYERACTARATISLPTPLSPSISTVALSVAAMRATKSRTSWIAGD